MKEEYVTFKQAKALKELGFPQDTSLTDYGWSCWGGANIENIKVYKVKECDLICISPTLSMVQKWLREEKNYIIESIYNYSRKFVYCIYINGDPDKMSFNLDPYNTYEQALSAGINKCINLLKNDDKK